MTKEDLYKQQLSAMGIYEPAFDAAIHTLAVMERELSRVQKAWKATAPDKDTPPSPLDPHYALIQSLRKDILNHRDALGLTPKGLQRLRRVPSSADTPAQQGASAPFMSVLDAIQASVRGHG